MTKAPSVRRAEAKAGKRPRRGTPEETRSRLIMAAARIFEERGYHGTDTNDIAREAGYSPGAFYKHFEDKRAIFLAVYDEWVTREWLDVAKGFASAKGHRELAERIVDAVFAHHRAWPGFRASLRALVATDAAVRKHHREARRRQLALAGTLGASGSPKTALSMLMIERIADAVADGEADALGIDEASARTFVIDELARRLARD